jgi:signal transduction histidine kinase
MNEQENRLLREKGLSFFGVVTASLSHEINNVIAIIGELSGLLDDLLLGAQQGRPTDNQKLRDLSERITAQVKKGEGIIKRLNRFAHSIDEPLKSFDLVELLKEIIVIAQRFAFLKGVRLETQLVEGSMNVMGDPFSLQQAIFICIELALAASEKNGAVTVTLGKAESGAKIAITGAPLVRTEDVDSKLSFLSILMEELGGKVEAAPADGDKHSLTLFVPESIDRR